MLKEDIKYRGELHITSRLITFGRLRIEIVPAEEDDSSFRMYQRYCDSIHSKKEKAMSSYINFLCLRALKQSEVSAEGSGAVYTAAWDPE